MNDINLSECYDSHLVLGAPCNLLLGLNPKLGLSPLYPLPSAPEVKRIPFEASELNEWEPFPTIDLCDDWTALLHALYDKWTLDKDSAVPFIINQPGLDELPTKQITQQLGIELEDISKDKGFALVRWRWTATTLRDKNLVVSDEQLIALSGIVENPGACMEFFETHGTHRVTSLDIGDCVYQVFVYSRNSYEDMKEKFPPSDHSGYKSLGFRYFTKTNDPSRKFCEYAGNLILASQTDGFQAICNKLDDPVNGLKYSLFMFFEKNEQARALQSLGRMTAIGFELSSLMDQTPVDLPLKTYWFELLNAALFHKFGSDTCPEFGTPSAPDYGTLYRAYTSEFVTTTCTSKISLKNVYVNLGEFSTHHLIHEDQVQTLFIYADVVEIDRTAELPGDKIVIICRHLVSRSRGSNAPVLKVGDDAYRNFGLNCETMDGVLRVVNTKTDAHRSIVDGASLVLDAAKPAATLNLPQSVSFEVNFKRAPKSAYFDTEADWLGENFLEGMELSVLTSEMILNYPMGEDITALGLAHLSWMSNVIEKAKKDTQEPLSTDFASLLLRALSLITTQREFPRPLFVPYIKHPKLEETITNIVDSLDEYQATMKEVHEAVVHQRNREASRQESINLNENIRAIGKFLLAQNDALQEKEHGLASYFQKLDEDKNESLNQAMARADELQKLVIAQNKAVENARTLMEYNIIEYKAEQAVMLILDLAGTVATIGTNVASIAKLPGTLATSATDIEKFMVAIKRIEHAIKMIQAFQKLWNNVIADRVRDIAGIVQYLRDIESTEIVLKDGTIVDAKFPDSLDWEEFELTVANAVDGIKHKVPAAGNYLTQVKILTARANAFLSSMSKVNQLIYEISLNKLQLDVYKKHQGRLKGLASSLKQEELSEEEALQVDLFGFGTILKSHSNRLTIKLVQTMALQDAALQYEYMQAPMPLRQYDILSIKEALSQRGLKSINALRKFRPQPTILPEPIAYTIKNVRVDRLNSPGGFRFDIPLYKSEFFRFSRVRIREITVAITNITKTDSNKLSVTLTSDSDPFYDRGLHREELTYSSLPQVFNYVYDLKSGKPLITNLPTRENEERFIKMTPFTEWNISLPREGYNEGIEFSDDLVDITLYFHCEAIFNPGIPASVERQLFTQRAQGESGPRPHDEVFSVPHDWGDKGLVEVTPMSATIRPLKATASAEAKIPEVISANVGKTFTQGWDVVCAISADELDRLFQQKYDREVKAYEQKLEECRQKGLSEEACLVESKLAYRIHPDPWEITASSGPLVLTLDLFVGAPRFSFGKNQPNQVTLTMPILKGSFIKKSVDRDTEGEPQILKKIQGNEPEKYHIEVITELEYLNGYLDGDPTKELIQQDVYVRLSEGTFKENITSDPFLGAGVSSQLQKFFTENLKDYEYSLGTVRYKAEKMSQVLQPVEFRFSTYRQDEHESRGVLLMFIQTRSGRPTPTSLNSTDCPLPLNKSAALIVSSEIIFKNFLLPKVSAVFGQDNIVLTHVAHDNPSSAWSLEAKKDAKLSLGKISRSYMQALHKKTVTCDIELPLSGLTAKPVGTGIEFHMETTWQQDLPVETALSLPTGGISHSVSKEKVPLDTSISGMLVPKVLPSQVVSFGNVKVAAKVNLIDKPPPPKSVWDFILELLGKPIVISRRYDSKKEMESIINNRISGFNVTLEDVSVFAVSNLLFPNDMVIQFDPDVYIPGDLVLTGSLSAKKTSTNNTSTSEVVDAGIELHMQTGPGPDNRTSQ